MICLAVCIIVICFLWGYVIINKHNKQSYWKGRLEGWQEGRLEGWQACKKMIIEHAKVNPKYNDDVWTDLLQ